MSAGDRVPLALAQELAGHVVRELGPHVARIEVVGSVRRLRPSVTDLEVVVEPLPDRNLFGEAGLELERIKNWAIASSAGVVRWQLSGPRPRRYVRVPRLFETALNLDLFLVHPPAQWGSIVAIRTGPAELSQHAVTRMREYGFRHVDGHVETEAGELVPTPDEESFFAAAGLPCLVPHLRDAAWMARRFPGQAPRHLPPNLEPRAP